MKRNIISVVGTRPNFITMQSIIKSFSKSKLNNYLVHTGQHYDYNMSEVFFEDLGMPEPDYFLNVKSENQIIQITSIMKEFDKVLTKLKPELVLVPGDVNSTLACALVAAKRNIPIAHVESGLRSFDNDMPEEINRIITDKLSQFLFVTEMSGYKNLIKEGASSKNIFFVGNSMIDTLVELKPKINKNRFMNNYKLEKNGYCLVTMHRPSNVDNESQLKIICKMLNQLSKQINVVFPIHPRTLKKINFYNIKLSKSIFTTSPLSYINFMSLVSDALIVLTDSGGIQEETTFLGTNCVTIRNNTERPITIEEGTNYLVGNNPEKVMLKVKEIIKTGGKLGKIPLKWDGKTGARIVKIIEKYFKEK